MAGEGRTQAQCREALPEIVLAADPPRPSWRTFLITQPDRRRGFGFDAPSLWVAGSKTGIDHSRRGVSANLAVSGPFRAT
jgi:hypothetical protein